MKAHIEAQGSLLSLTVVGFKSKPNPNGGRRGIIRMFSRSSRRRLLRFMARLKVRKIRATFITLTFSEMVTHARAKEVFKRFTMRMRRAYATMSLVWRLEYQPKRGAIHFHLLCFNLPYWEQKALQETWEDCTEESRSICDIRLVHGARSVMAYVSKYIAKVDHEAPASLDDGSYQHEARDHACSRFWGYINKELLPLGQKLTGVLTCRHTIRSLSSFMWSLIGSDNPYNSISAHLFADNATWLCERAIEEGGLYSDEYGWSLCLSENDVRVIEIMSQPSPEPHSGGRFGYSGDHARPSEASSSQPCISGWIRASSRTEVQERLSPFFDNGGIIDSISPLCKDEDHAVV